MADDLKLRFRVTDEGTAILDKIKNKIGDIDTSAKKMSSSLSLIRLDSLINLGERAFRTGQQIYNVAKQTVDWADDLGDTA